MSVFVWGLVIVATRNLLGAKRVFLNNLGDIVHYPQYTDKLCGVRWGRGGGKKLQLLPLDGVVMHWST